MPGCSDHCHTKPREKLPNNPHDNGTMQRRYLHASRLHAIAPRPTSSSSGHDKRWRQVTAKTWCRILNPRPPVHTLWASIRRDRRWTSLLTWQAITNESYEKRRCAMPHGAENMVPKGGQPPSVGRRLAGQRAIRRWTNTSVTGTDANLECLAIDEGCDVMRPEPRMRRPRMEHTTSAGGLVPKPGRGDSALILQHL